VTHLVTLRPPGRLLACLVLAAGPLAAGPAAAQVAGFAGLPSFAWPHAADEGGSRWDGAFARLSTGFEVGSSKRFGSYAGPTFGFEGGRMWQEGRFVYGVVGGFDYLAAGGRSPGFGGLGYSRDFAGALQVKVGALLTPDVLVYAKAGAVAVHETWRFGPSAAGLGFDRDAVAVRPDARVGVEWRVNDRVTLSVEGGVGGTPFYR
jgi:outer membrane immunogenic protein